MARRTIRDNSQVVTTTVFGVDPLSANLATTMVMATGTASPMTTNGHWAPGDKGSQTNAFRGAVPYPVQNFRGAILPIANPGWTTIGYGASTLAAAQLPNTNLSSWTGVG